MGPQRLLTCSHAILALVQKKKKKNSLVEEIFKIDCSIINKLIKL